MSRVEHRHFCPQAGLVPAPQHGPATLAGERVCGGARRRMAVAAFAASGLWGLGLVVEATRGRADAVLAGVTAAVGLASVGVLVTAARARRPRALGAVSSLYLIGTSFAVAAAEQHLGMGGGLGAGVSWAALWVAFFPLMVPGGPRGMLAKALAAATMTPLAFVLFVVVPGRPVPGALELLALFAPVYLAALLAWTGASVLFKLGRELSEARSVGTYALVRRLGEGGMGDVWEARHRMLARPVALKVIKRPEQDVRGRRAAPTSTSIARFRREARALARLKSPHTVELFDFGATEDGRLFYAMELLEGMDLEALVKAHGPMSAGRVVRVLRQALDSLGEAHRRGMVHRDVKPANLHLGRYGLVHDHLKVLDFGLVKSAATTNAGLGPTLTADGTISGTPAYMAPESLVGDGEVDGRADVYALGCVAVYLLTGERVFDADDVIRAAVAHVTERPVPPSRRGADVPPDLEAMIMACLEKDPVRRPDAQSLSEMLDTLSVEPWTDEDARLWWTRERPFAERPSEAPSAPAPTRRFTQPSPQPGHA